MSHKSTLLHKAEFNPKMKQYLMWTGILICTVSMVLIPLIPLWAIFGTIYLNKYFSRLECELTTRSLRFKKGYIFHTERTIPLDKIQDLTFKEGPLLKYFGISKLSVETAGGSAQGTADLSLIGIINAGDFRSLVLEQRDKVTDNKTTHSTESDADSSLQVLVEIRDSLKRIEEKLSK